MYLFFEISFLEHNEIINKNSITSKAAIINGKIRQLLS